MAGQRQQNISTQQDQIKEAGHISMVSLTSGNNSPGTAALRSKEPSKLQQLDSQKGLGNRNSSSKFLNKSARRVVSMIEEKPNDSCLPTSNASPNLSIQILSNQNKFKRTSDDLKHLESPENVGCQIDFNQMTNDDQMRETGGDGGYGNNW